MLRRRALLAGSFLAAVAIAVVAVATSWHQPPKRPHIVLVSIDTLRADHLGSYGYPRPTSPRLDAFRREAVLAREVIANAPSTLPAHASLFTSLIPQHHGARHSKNQPLAPEATTLAEVLAAAGYATRGYVASGQMVRQFGLAQGFEVYEELPEDMPFRSTVRRAFYHLDREPESRPLFLFLHTYQVHHPYTPDRASLVALDARYGAGELPEYTPERLWELSQQGGVGPDELRRIVDAYDAEIRSMDEGLGELLDEMRQRGLYDDTILVFTSDHGEELGEHGYVGWHSHSLYDELLKIPLILRLPGGRHAGRTIEGAIRQIDIAPTILGLADIAVPREFSGRDVIPLLGRRPGFVLPAVLARERMPWENDQRWGLRAEGWKLQYGELYDLGADPGETTDVAAGQPGRLQRMEQALNEAVAARARLEAPAVTLDAAAEESLRALGYVR